MNFFKKQSATLKSAEVFLYSNRICWRDKQARRLRSDWVRWPREECACSANPKLRKGLQTSKPVGPSRPKCDNRWRWQTPETNRVNATLFKKLFFLQKFAEAYERRQEMAPPLNSIKSGKNVKNLKIIFLFNKNQRASASTVPWSIWVEMVQKMALNSNATRDGATVQPNKIRKKMFKNSKWFSGKQESTKLELLLFHDRFEWKRSIKWRAIQMRHKMAPP